MGAVGVRIKAETRSTPPVSSADVFAQRPWLASLVLLLVTVALYYPVHNHPFTNYDDRDYVNENPMVQRGLTPSMIHWAFTSYYAENWHPLTWLSHALDCQLFGLNPAGPHDVNLLLHAVDAVLLFWVLLRATGFAGRSFMVAALFALHPMNVESVAWIAERKNVLSMLFFVLALGAYQWYASTPASAKTALAGDPGNAARSRAGRYGVVAGLYALGLMAKPQVITLPFVLLLWDYWPLGRLAIRHSPFASRQNGASEISGEKRIANSEQRLWWLLLEKVPLLLLAAASALVTLKAQHRARSWFPRPYRVGNAVLSYGLYLKKAIWPTRMAVLYPHPGWSLQWSRVVIAGVVLLAITVMVIVGHRHRYLPVGWFWFLGTLVPMIGIMQVGLQAMADRYAYISFIGLFLMICWGAAELAQRWDAPGALLPAVSVVCLLLLAGVARHQLSYWETDEALWAHTLEVTGPTNWMAESQYGSALAMKGNVAEGIRHLQNALAINPDDANSNMGIAIYELSQGDFRNSVLHYEKALSDKGLRNSFRAHGYVGLAKAYRALGETEKSREAMQEAAQLQ
jgi:protein O-mannosyl-transferase